MKAKIQEPQFLKTMPKIVAWLNKYEIKHFILLEDEKWGYKVNIDGTVNLASLNLDFIPVKFNIIEGSFICSGNLLKNLDFAPEKVFGDFNCNATKITSLKGAPKLVTGVFTCMKNNLKTLEGCPEKVGMEFICIGVGLTTLKFLPKSVGGLFFMSDNEKIKGCNLITDFQGVKKMQLEELTIKEKKFLQKNLSKPQPTSLLGTPEVYKI